MWKIKLQKIVGNFLISFENLPEWKAHLEIFTHIQASPNSLYFTEHSRRVTLRFKPSYNTVYFYSLNL